MLLLLSVIFLVLAPFYIIYKPPHLLVRYFERRWPNVLWQVQTSKKVVALTIDDGPSQFTSEIMDVLSENEATATFFIIGSQIDGRQQTLESLVQRGHELANHAMHDEPSRSLSDEVLREEILYVERKLYDAHAAVNSKPSAKYFRPGSGFFSDRMLEVLQKLDYRLVLGSIYPHDPFIPYWWVNARHILSMLRPGAIIICHDRRSWTVPMLRKVVPEIRRQGYRIVTVTQLLQESQATPG